MVVVLVRDNNVDWALRLLKRRNQRNGFNKALKRSQAYIKPSVDRKRRTSESRRRMQRNLQRRMQREGY